MNIYKSDRFYLVTTPVKKSWEKPVLDVSAVKDVVLSTDEIERLIVLAQFADEHSGLAVDAKILDKLRSSLSR